MTKQKPTKEQLIRVLELLEKLCNEEQESNRILGLK